MTLILLHHLTHLLRSEGAWPLLQWAILPVWMMVKGLVASSNHSLCCMGTDTKYMTPTFLSCSLRILSDKDKYVSDVSLHVATTITWLYCQLGYGSELQDFAPPMTWLYLQFEFLLHSSFLSSMFNKSVLYWMYPWLLNSSLNYD